MNSLVLQGEDNPLLSGLKLLRPGPAFGDDILSYSTDATTEEELQQLGEALTAYQLSRGDRALVPIAGTSRTPSNGVGGADAAVGSSVIPTAGAGAGSVSNAEQTSAAAAAGAAVAAAAAAGAAVAAAAAAGAAEAAAAVAGGESIPPEGFPLEVQDESEGDQDWFAAAGVPFDDETTSPPIPLEFNVLLLFWYSWYPGRQPCHLSLKKAAVTYSLLGRQLKWHLSQSVFGLGRPEGFKLVMKGREIQDEEELGDAGVEPGCCIRVVMVGGSEESWPERQVNIQVR